MIASFFITIGMALGLATSAMDTTPTEPTTELVAPAAKSLYDFSLKTLDGQALNLSQYKGKKVLLVNVASECGYTPQYGNLQKLHEKYGNKVVIIGVPANNFGGQEPGDSKKIKTFCTKNYGVTFMMAEKISVKGADADPLYKWLAEKTEAPSWNFCKYLINEKGEVVKFYKSSVDPLSDEITKAL
jgi:glutathione peroxidase